jgi:serine/threonine protein kinase
VHIKLIAKGITALKKKCAAARASAAGGGGGADTAPPGAEGATVLSEIANENPKLVATETMAELRGPRPYEANGMKHVKWLGAAERVGRVQLSVDTQLERQCVLKLEDNPRVAEHQVEVMKALAGGDLHVVKLLHYYPGSDADSRSCLKFDPLLHDLDKFIESVGEVQPGARIDIARSLLEALHYIHEVRSPAFPRGIMHGDVKPQNVMLDVGNRVRLIDFDEARGVGASVTVPRKPGVTVEYTSPEMFRARAADFCEPVLTASEAHDIACAGLVLWKLIDRKHRAAFETKEEAIAALSGLDDVIVDVKRIDTGACVLYLKYSGCR